MADDRPVPDLYETDFYAWTQAQAGALRSGVTGSNTLEPGRLAEEIEDLGKRDLRAVETLVMRIIQHLHDLRCGRRFEPREHWKKEIRAFRDQVDDRLTSSLRLQVEADLERLHTRAASEAERWMALDEPFFDPLDPARRWTLQELLGEADDPVPLIVLDWKASTRPGG